MRVEQSLDSPPALGAQRPDEAVEKVNVRKAT